MTNERAIEKKTLPETYLAGFVAAGLLAVFYLSASFGYPFFHNLDELLSIAVSFAIFMLTWNSRHYFFNSYIQFIGVGFLFIGILDAVPPALNNLNLRQMSILNYPTQFWLVSRYLQALSLFIAPFFLKRKMDLPLVFASYIAVTGLLFALIFTEVFPPCCGEDSNVTPFKIFSEYVIIAIFAGAIALLIKKKSFFDNRVFRLLLWSLSFSLLESLVFAVQNSLYDSSHIFGHYFETISYYLIYRAIVVTGLMKPYDLIFRNLNRSLAMLEKSEEQFRSVTETARDAIITITADDTVVLWNRGAEQIFGYAPEEMIGRPLSVIIPEECHGQHLSGMGCASSSGRLRGSGKTYETIGKHKNGTEVPVEISLSFWQTNEGRFFTAIIRDVTSRKKMEDQLHDHQENLEEMVRARTSELVAANRQLEAESSQRMQAEQSLKESEEKLRVIFENANDGILLADIEEMKLVSCNRTACAMLGYRPEELSCLSIRDIHPEEDFPMVSEALHKIIRGEMRFATDIPVRKKDGSVFYADISSSQPIALNGKRHLIGIFRDMTERKQAEIQHIRLVAAVESAADAIAIIDNKGITQYINPAFTRVTGCEQSDVLGKPLRLARAENRERGRETHREIWRTLHKGEIWSGRLISRRKDGSTYEEDATISPVRTASGDIVNYIVVKRDVTEKIRLESIAEAVSMMNNIGYIFSGIRHEIGNPVNSIKMTLSVLRANLETYQQAEVLTYLERALGEIGRIEYLLRNLKTFNMFETPELQQIDVHSFIDKFLALVRVDFSHKDIALRHSVSDDAASCYADPRALQQVLLNIFTNAADACKNKTNAVIEMDITRVSDTIRFQVRDNGKGMTPEQTRDLFRPFFTSKQGGTGLGLVIAKKMVTKMNGTIEVTSSKQQGTTVTILLPERKS